MSNIISYLTSISRLLLGESCGVAAVVIIIGGSLKGRIFRPLRLSLIENVFKHRTEQKRRESSSD